MDIDLNEFSGKCRGHAEEEYREAECPADRRRRHADRFCYRLFKGAPAVYGSDRTVN